MINYILHMIGLCPCSHSHFDLQDLLLLFPALYIGLYNLLNKLINK
jgi:hypothetical protein